MNPQDVGDWEPVRARIREQARALFGIEDSSGLELFVMLQRTAHLSRLLEAGPGDDLELSGPRWRLLLSLLIAEESGDRAGLSPTSLSHSHRVSKNTISALLRGLEAQGLIQRALDPDDLRAFRIRLTPAGRDYLLRTAPERIERLNRLLAGLSAREQEQLSGLLAKLQRSLAEQCLLTPPAPFYSAPAEEKGE